MTPTEMFIKTLTNLKTGDLSLLRTHAGQGLDESLEGFDLFTGIWWPLREKNQAAPRRSVAWLIAKLYAFCPIHQERGCALAAQLRRCRPSEQFFKKCDRLLLLPNDRLEPALQWAIGTLASNKLRLDWVQLTDDLSIWERETTRLRWAEQLLENREEK
ncbi:MAG TPA: type I-E CRISPR-associated protein Cse2/CasB [Candidatus Hydrogenedentes bacterium]|nr:type I-E CRISPR-associated protein Cse2/CasB [Candidatus Hydrogenedentota bacterium]HOV74742.1 type I-E CRISPR-associated protein Cse2/CasB [Candidatus Hydrogenedentota bacterium]